MAVSSFPVLALPGCDTPDRYYFISSKIRSSFAFSSKKVKNCFMLRKCAFAFGYFAENTCCDRLTHGSKAVSYTHLHGLTEHVAVLLPGKSRDLCLYKIAGVAPEDTAERSVRCAQYLVGRAL